MKAAHPLETKAITKATTRLMDELHRRTAYEALAGHHMGYRYLLIARPHAPVSKAFEPHYVASIQAAFMHMNTHPDERYLPPGYVYEAVFLPPLKDDETRAEVFRRLNDERLDSDEGEEVW